jgi:putative oxidoreductase
MVSWDFLTDTLRRWEWIGQLLARLSVGLLFFLSGGGKLFVRTRREEMRDTLYRAGIRAPAVTAILVSTVEWVCGALLVFGLLTPLCCLMLIGVMVVALSTTVLPGIKSDSAISWLSASLYLPETLYVVILVWLLLSGPGWLSVDHLIFSSAGT